MHIMYCIAFVSIGACPLDDSVSGSQYTASRDCIVID